mmetsp:Transcript_53023/g.113838  ORF Transcript_53023/g.113838 Transcript_53023/m.113838 type:complete len:245 (+) Transcript_53023:188-922(+)
MSYDDRSDLSKHLLRERNSPLDIFLGVRKRHEARLVLRWRQVDTPRKHCAMPPREFLRVALRSVCEARHGALAKEKAEHPTDVAPAHSVACLSGSIEDAVDELSCELVEVSIGVAALQPFEGLDPGHHRKRVPAKRPCLVHGPRRGHHLHDVLAPAVGANWKAAPDHLPHGGHVRSHAEVLLRPTVGDTKPGHDFIEDEEGAVLGGELAQTLEEFLRGRNEARVPHHGLEDHGRHFIILQECLH